MVIASSCPNTVSIKRPGLHFCQLPILWSHQLYLECGDLADPLCQRSPQISNIGHYPQVMEIQINSLSLGSLMSSFRYLFRDALGKASGSASGMPSCFLNLMPASSLVSSSDFVRSTSSLPGDQEGKGLGRTRLEVRGLENFKKEGAKNCPQHHFGPTCSTINNMRVTQVPVSNLIVCK